MIFFGKNQEIKLIITHHFARPSAWTFTIKPFQELISRYVENNGFGWADPFSGQNSPAEFTNDMNPERDTKYHLDAKDFADVLPFNLNGILFDPPYSYRQITEHYKSVGIKASSLDTSVNFYYRVMKKLHPKLQIGGYAISWGWNSNGFPKSWGYETIEIMMVGHGLHHNDTIAVVQKKIANLPIKEKLR
mgnify:FL=1